MKFLYLKCCAVILGLLFGCGQKNQNSLNQPYSKSENTVRYAKGLSIRKFSGFTVVSVTNPWPKASKNYTYILKKAGANIPDSLKQFETVQVPVKKIIVTSTTHIPSLEMLGEANSLIGFPNLSYISSETVRNRIEEGKVRELGANQNLNIEVAIDIAPDVIIGFGIDNNNPALDNLQKSGLKVVLDGDWNEQTALGKAEWIKLFGALYDKDNQAERIFSAIEKNYDNTLALVKNSVAKPTVMGGAIFENHWYMPQGESWGALMIEQAGGDYLWDDSKGTGSLSLPFETVFEKAENADFWIGPGEFVTLNEMAASNPHYSQFKAFKNKNVYSYSTKKGKTGGLIYYELAPNRPDLVLKDLVKILHPELLPEHRLFFFEKLN